MIKDVTTPTILFGDNLKAGVIISVTSVPMGKIRYGIISSIAKPVLKEGVVSQLMNVKTLTNDESHYDSKWLELNSKDVKDKKVIINILPTEVSKDVVG
ncbi:MAG: hypothetical protein PHY48_14445 [Candidatus Cloacimonetes bacterium]|nr:hypothetical protein [Candidatus Cloacimonadota bacterium]